MAMNIKDPEAERLVAEVAARTGHSKTATIRELAREKLVGLEAGDEADQDAERFMRFLRTEIWPQVPPEERGRPPMTKAEREDLLGIGPEGV
jgi:antitoxin VapB